MKRSMRWGKEEDESSSSDDSSSDSESKSNNCPGKSKPKTESGSQSKQPSKVKSAKRKSGAIDFDALSRHGYKGGLSVLKVPPPKEEEKPQDWSWSNGKDTAKSAKDIEESFEERQKTRAVVAQAEQQAAEAIALKEKKSVSFSQKEKRKRDLGQASRGKSYVEEEKRLLRDSGVYSGFDS